MTTFDRDNLPMAGWTTWRKLVPTEMVRIHGPFTAITSDGPAFCEDGWLAIDARGFPYPIDATEQSIIYEQVLTLDLDDHPELAETIRAHQAGESTPVESSSRRPRLSREAREYVARVDWGVTTIADCYGLEPDDTQINWALFDKGEDDPPIAEFTFQDDALRVAEVLRHVSAGARPASPTDLVLDEVATERERQDSKWGQQNHDVFYWFAILGEEVGEVSKELTKSRATEVEGLDTGTRLRMARQELIQTAAVAVAFIESLDRNELADQRVLDFEERLAASMARHQRILDRLAALEQD